MGDIVYLRDYSPKTKPVLTRDEAFDQLSQAFAQGLGPDEILTVERIYPADTGDQPYVAPPCDCG